MKFFQYINGKFSFLVVSEDKAAAHKYGRWKGGEYKDYEIPGDEKQELYWIELSKKFMHRTMEIPRFEMQLAVRANDKRHAVEVAKAKFDISYFNDDEICVHLWRNVSNWWIVDGTRRTGIEIEIESEISFLTKELKKAQEKKEEYLKIKEILNRVTKSLLDLRSMPPQCLTTLTC